MKTFIQTVAGIAVLLGLAFGGAYLAAFGWSAGIAMEQVASQNVGGSYQPSQRYFLTAQGNDATNAGATEATTTKVYQKTTSTASSTITGQLDRGDEVNVVLRAIASSSPLAVYNLAMYVSDNNVDWYPAHQATSTVTNPLVQNIGPSIHQWSLATTTNGAACPGSGNADEVCTQMSFKGIYAKYFQIRSWVTGSNAAVYGYASVKEQVPN